MKNIITICIMLVITTNTIVSANLAKVTLRGNYKHNKAIVAYIKTLPNKKIKTLTDLAYTLWQEDRGNKDIYEGYMMVASTVLNRVNLKSNIYGKTIYQVLHKRRQFSCWGKSGKYQSKSINSDYREFLIALKVANRYVHGDRPRLTTALYYHTRTVYPKWRKRLTIVAYCGNHIFYKR